jgi:hypothetical protein
MITFNQNIQWGVGVDATFGIHKPILVCITKLNNKVKIRILKIQLETYLILMWIDTIAGITKK